MASRATLVSRVVVQDKDPRVRRVLWDLQVSVVHLESRDQGDGRDLVA